MSEIEKLDDAVYRLTLRTENLKSEIVHDDIGCTRRRQQHVDDMELAIQALQEIIEREKSKIECEYCNVLKNMSETGLSIIARPNFQICITKRPLVSDYYMVVSEYEELRNIRGQYDNSPFRSSNMKINFCPICGRVLS